MWYILPAILMLAAVVVYDQTQIIVWVGSYPVQVQVERGSTKPIDTISVNVLFSREWEYSGGDPALIDTKWRTVPTSGESFTIQVKCSGRDSGLGRVQSYARESVLVLDVRYIDGSSEFLVAEIPESHSNRILTVRVP